MVYDVDSSDVGLSNTQDIQENQLDDVLDIVNATQAEQILDIVAEENATAIILDEQEASIATIDSEMLQEEEPTKLLVINEAGIDYTS